MENLNIGCEGYARQDEERYNNMLIVKDACLDAGVPIPTETAEFILSFEGEEEDIKKRTIKRLRPMIDKGVFQKNSAIIIDLEAIDQEIDFIKIYHEEQE